MYRGSISYLSVNWRCYGGIAAMACKLSALLAGKISSGGVISESGHQRHEESAKMSAASKIRRKCGVWRQA